ncbi:MAG: hypothetical protein Q7S87_03440 [Agitococcus sp.]|nr:hypothetical protein [Agitococcus sp.]
MHTTISPAAPFRFSTHEQYTRFIQAWKQLAKDTALTAEHIAFHALVLNKPIARAFSPITNTNKLANGCHAWHSAQCALHYHKMGTIPAGLALLTSEEQTSLILAATRVLSAPFPPSVPTVSR